MIPVWSREDRTAIEPLEPLHNEDIREDAPPEEPVTEQKDEK